MKKAIALVLLAVMTLLCVPSASASWLTLAQDGGAQDIILSASGSAQNLSAKFSPSICDTDEIEKFPSFSEVDGVYTARSYAADTALRSLVSGSSNGCFFTVEVSGVKELGIIEPVLTAYYRSSQPTNAAAIAIAAGGKQFVFKAKSEMQAIGRRYVEVVKAPLTAEGLAFIASLSSAESVNLRLCGSRVYTTEIKRGAANGIALVEAQSLNSSKAVFDIISPLMTGEYLLWDLSAGWWEAKNGFAPEYETADVISGDDYGIKYDKLGMLAYGDNTSASRSLQTMLVSAGFMYGTPTQNFNEETRTAVLGAQSYFGFIESGCVTPALVASISGKPAEKKADESAANDAQSFDGKLAVSIARAWLAKGASPVFGGDAAALKPINSDNLLLIADGRLVSAVLPELRLYRDLSAYFVCGDYKFEASLVCEANGGKSLITEALPLSDTRLVIYSEIPAPAAKLAGWKLVISYGDIEKTWELK